MSEYRKCVECLDFYWYSDAEEDDRYCSLECEDMAYGIVPEEEAGA